MNMIHLIVVMIQKKKIKGKITLKRKITNIKKR